MSWWISAENPIVLGLAPDLPARGLPLYVSLPAMPFSIDRSKSVFLAACLFSDVDCFLGSANNLFRFYLTSTAGPRP